MDITELLAFAVKNSASDLHLSSGLPPMIRVNGDLQKINIPPLDQKTITKLIYDIMSDKHRKLFEEFFETDFSFEIPELARFRANVFLQDRGIAGVFRMIPSEIKSLEDLKLPGVLAKLASKSRGLVLITGPTGSGKTTTLAAMLDHINATQQHHIITIEDPIEFVHTSKKSLINQREIARDTLSFSKALRSSLREDPDVILVGEMRDIETIRLALTAAETGHLVLSTLHTSSATKTINRIVDVFPGEEQSMVRTMLSESLEGVISQTLVKRKGEEGRVAATEIMVCNPAIRNLIRENKIAQMYSTIQTGFGEGMQTLDQNLRELVNQHEITRDVARQYAVDEMSFQ